MQFAADEFPNRDTLPFPLERTTEPAARSMARHEVVGSGGQERRQVFFTRLEHLLNRFSKHRDFLRTVAETGGETNFIIHLPGGANIGDSLSEHAAAGLADLKVSLGVEVFPIMKPREDEYIWAEDV